MRALQAMGNLFFMYFLTRAQVSGFVSKHGGGLVPMDKQPIVNSWMTFQTVLLPSQIPHDLSHCLFLHSRAPNCPNRFLTRHVSEVMSLHSLGPNDNSVS